MREKFERAESADVLAHLALCERCDDFDFENRCPVCGEGLIEAIPGPICDRFSHKARRVLGRYTDVRRRRRAATAPPPEPAERPPVREREPAPAGAPEAPRRAPKPMAERVAPPKPARMNRDPAPPHPRPPAAAPPPPAAPARPAPAPAAAAPAEPAAPKAPTPPAAPAAAPKPKPAAPPAAPKTKPAAPPTPKQKPPAPKPDPKAVALEAAYATLGIEPSAQDDEVRRAFREKAKACHPDRVSHLAPAFRELAEKQMLELNVAYETVLKARESAAAKSA